MLKTKSKISLIVFLTLILVSSCCFATTEPNTTVEPTSSENLNVTEQENSETTENQNSNEDIISKWVSSDLYLIDDVINLDKIVDGNAFIIGKDVTISGEIAGDLFIIADKINIEGSYIYSNLFACANEITINGVIYDVYANCNTFNLENNGFIYRDMRVNASNININGKVKRNAYVSAKNISFKENAESVIFGNLNYSSKGQIEIPKEAINGEINYTAKGLETKNSIINTILYYVLNLLQTLFFTFIITMLLIWLSPKFIERIGNMKVKKSFVSLGIGLVAPLIFIMVSLLLILTGIGTTIFVASTFSFIVLALIGTSISSIFLGKLFTKIFKKEGNIKFVLFTLISCLILWAISQIPVVGGIFGLIISIFGIGTTLVNMIYRKEKEETKVDEN